MGLPGKGLLKSSQRLFVPLKNQSRGTSRFLGQISKTPTVIQVPPNTLGLLFDRPTLFLLIILWKRIFHRHVSFWIRHSVISYRKKWHFILHGTPTPARSPYLNFVTCAPGRSSGPRSRARKPWKMSRFPMRSGLDGSPNDKDLSRRSREERRLARDPFDQMNTVPKET